MLLATPVQSFGSGEKSLDQIAITNTPGMTFYRPANFYGGEMPFPEIPEIEFINTNDQPQLEGLSRFLESQGVALSLGSNPNRDSAFDLYAPLVGIVLDQPAARMGLTPESEIGRMHFMTHDGVHLWAGIPGPRMEDMKDPKKLEEIKERLVQVVLDKEALASAWTAIEYTRWYWNWRNKQGDNKDNQDEFEKLNFGLFSIGEIDHDEFINILLSIAKNDWKNHWGILKRKMDYGYMVKALEAGVPALYPNLRFSNKMLDKLGVRAQAGIMRGLLPGVSALSAINRGATGYYYQRSYARGLVDFYYQEWFTEWATLFNYGIPIDEMEEQLADKIQQFREQKHMTDIAENPEYLYEIMYLRNEVAQFGRKLIEMKEVWKNNQGIASAQDMSDYQDILDRAVETVQNLDAYKASTTTYSPEKVQEFKAYASSLMDAANTRFPVDTYIPLYVRPTFSDYSNFWYDSYGYALERPEIMTSFLNSGGIQKKLAELNDEERKAINKGQEYEEKEVVLGQDTTKYISTILAQAFRKENKQDYRLPEEGQGETAYLRRLQLFALSFKEQIHAVALPQIMEHRQLSIEDRKTLYDLLAKANTTIQQAIGELAGAYKNEYVAGNASNAQRTKITDIESQVSKGVNNINITLVKVLNILEHGGSLQDLDKELGYITQAVNGIENNESFDFVPGFLPLNAGPRAKGMIQMGCTAISGLCRPGFGSIRSYARAINYDQVFNLEDGNRLAINGVQQLEDLPEDAAVIFVVNHDQALGDIKVVQEIAKSIGIKRDMVLTRKEVNIQNHGFPALDKNTLFIEDKEWMPKAIDRMKTAKGRSSLTVAPEGTLPYWGAQMPLTSKVGAWVAARRAANALKESGKQVFVVNVTSNTLENVTSREATDLVFDVQAPIAVPDGEVSKNDPWVLEHRESFEAMANVGRGTNMPDLIDRMPLRGTEIPAAARVQPYNNFSNFFAKWNEDQRKMACENWFAK